MKTPTAVLFNDVNRGVVRVILENISYYHNVNLDGNTFVLLNMNDGSQIRIDVNIEIVDSMFHFL